ncbi:MAG: CRTAC1 family protein [Candidatus Cloacimonetes bacterium]|nr:CRTAC1 family protein [Candidatus Cloacimonadota bacterium]
MRKVFFFSLLLLMFTQIAYGFSLRRPLTPEERYQSWRDRLFRAGRDSVTVRYAIQSEARKLMKNKEVEARYYGMMGLIIAEADTSETNPLGSHIVRLFPASEETFKIARDDFYDQIYPYWEDDHEKILIIENLLEKYPASNWRRTMYQYLCYSLYNIKDFELMLFYLEEWRDAFPEDYLPWYTAARFTKDTQADSTLYFAEKAYHLSLAPKKVTYYPEEEWQLEKRSAKIISAYIYGRLLTDASNSSLAEQILTDAIENNELGIDDETNTCSLHYALAKLYDIRNEQQKAIEHCCRALVLGDSRNVYTPVADSLLIKLAGLDTAKKSTLQYSRERLNYQDVIFSDVTSKTGLQNVSGSRIAWGDFDEDGWEDFLLSGAGRLFKNFKGKNFVDVTKDVFSSDINFGGALWGDLDNDGDLDIVTKDPEAVWINIDYKFHRFQRNSAFTDNGISTEGMALGDVNRDGNLDLYLANYEGNDKYYQDKLLIGLGDGSFKDMTSELNALPEDMVNRAGRGVNMGDYNNDGELDIYVSNYRLNRNYFFVNHGNGRLREKAEVLGIAGDQMEGWWGHTIGSEWGDFDNDGDLDLICANLAHPRYIDFSNRTMLYENQGRPYFTFKDIRRQAGIKYEETNSEPSWGDVNNDGYLDLYLTDVYDGRRSFLYLNNGDKTFREVTWLSGTRHFNGWGSAFCDYDKDGDLDLLVCGGNIQLFRNDTVNENNWLEIEVQPTVGCDGIGTRMSLTGKDWIQIREIQGGKGTTNQHSLIQHFGLGNHKSGMQIRIEFPSGISRTATIKDINYRYTIKEGL